MTKKQIIEQIAEIDLVVLQLKQVLNTNAAHKSNLLSYAIGSELMALNDERIKLIAQLDEK